MKEKIRIIIAEDKALMRKSLVALLKDYEQLEVVAEAANGRELIDLLKSRQADVVLLDIEMPVMTGPEALKIIHLRFPEVKVIMLSIHNDISYVRNCLSLGAKGYLAKDCIPENLVDAITQVHQKGFYLDEKRSNDLLRNSVYTVTEPKSRLSEREREVLKELCKGHTEKEIAQKLNISQHTVHFHRMNIYTKTHTHNSAQLVGYVMQNNLL